MPAAIASAALIVAASLLAGRALLALTGRRAWTWLAAPVGLALLLSLSGIVAGLGGRGTAIAISLTAVIAAAVLILWWTAPMSEGVGGARRGLRSMDVRKMRRRDAEHPPASVAHVLAPLGAAMLAAAFAALPFLVAGRVGILGMGLVNDDMAYHLLMADWIAERFSPEPELIADGYPLGPHGLVAGLSAILGARSIDVFAGLALAIPALTALVAFALLGSLRTGPRIAVSALAAMPYLAAAYLAQQAFKEPLMALFLLAFAALLTERPGRAAERRYRWGRGVALGALAAGAVYVYSFPGLAWLLGMLGLWGLLELWRRRGEGVGEALRGVFAAAAPATLAGVVAWAAISLPDAGRVLDFADFRALDPDRAHDGGLGNLRGHLSPLQALGIWPSGEFRLAAGQGALPAIAFYVGALLAAGGLAIGLWRWVRANGAAIPVALLGAALIYAGARGFGTVYTSAKALAIAAPLVALLALGGLLARDAAGRIGLARALLAGALAAAMAASSFLVLRQAPVGPEDHLDQLAEIRPLVAGEDLLFLGRDNFVLYGLRGSRPYTHVRNFYNPYSVRPNRDLQRVQAKFDFDSVDARTLGGFPYVLTTRAAYASGPPPDYEAVAQTEGYVLWRRQASPAGRRPVEDDLRPGARLECGPAGRERAVGGAAWLRAEPALAGDRGWQPSPDLEGGSATTQLHLPAGDWELSLQYVSTTPLTLSAPSLEVELPGSLGYRGAVPFWAAGRVEGHPGGPLEIEATPDRPSFVGRLIGASAVAHLGTIAATPSGSGYGEARVSAEPPFPGSSATLSRAAEACGRYADWLGPRPSP